MLSENLTAWQWGYKDPSDMEEAPDKKYHFGFCWEDPDLVGGTPPTTADAYKTDPSFRKINGQRIDNAVLFNTFKRQCD